MKNPTQQPLFCHLVIFSMVLMLGGCSRSKRSVAKSGELRKRITTFLSEGATVAESAPDRTDESLLSEPFAESIYFHAGDPRSNALILTQEQLADLAGEASRADEVEYLDLRASAAFLDHFSERDDPTEAGEEWGERFSNWLEARYWIVVRTARYNPPMVRGGSLIAGGSIATVVSVYDREEKKWRGSFLAVGVPPEDIRVESSAGSIADSIRAIVSESLRRQLLQQIDDKLTRLAGAEVEFDETVPVKASSEVEQK
ncbi:MAG: hypothetical protein AAF236_07510 [Verrucomicrobiota bacterium]